MKRTPLNRGDKQLKQTGGLGRSELRQSRKRIKPRSDKTQELYETERIPLVVKLLAERPFCQACERVNRFLNIPLGYLRRSVDLHEVATRGRTGGVQGDAWLDPDNILCVCRECHMWITDHPTESKELGLVT